MPLITSDVNGRLFLDRAFLKRRNLSLDSDYWLDEREGDFILLHRRPDPRKLYLEITTQCNLQCRTCIRNAWSDLPAHMTQESFQHVLEGLTGLPQLNRVIFTSFGEPLCHPLILKMVEDVRNLGFAVTIGTNGLLLTPGISEELVRMGVDRLVVSVDGVRPETYESVRGAQLSQVLENIRALNDLKYRMGSLTPALGIEFVILRSNIDELADLTGLASRLNAARVLVSNVLPYSEEMRQEVLYGYQPTNPFKSSSFPVRADAWVMWGTVELPRMHWGAERRCRFVYDRSMVVGWDGQVSPCYALSHNYKYYAIDGRQKQVTRYSLGDTNCESLAEIWMSEAYVRFRSAVRAFHFPSCPDCDLRLTCDLREHNQGCWGWNPSCADCLWAQDIIRCP